MMFPRSFQSLNFCEQRFQSGYWLCYFYFFKCLIKMSGCISTHSLFHVYPRNVLAEMYILLQNKLLEKAYCFLTNYKTLYDEKLSK